MKFVKNSHGICILISVILKGALMLIKADPVMLKIIDPPDAQLFVRM